MGLLNLNFQRVDIILAGLIGAIIWDLVTWYFGLPSSSSHALIGGLVGSALIVGGWNAIIVPGVEKVMIFMIISPVAGFVIAFVLANDNHIFPQRIQSHYSSTESLESFRSSLYVLFFDAWSE